MRAILKLFTDFIRKPEWVAAVALLIQAVILWLQARILRRHGKTMEEHARIAKDQAATAELIGRALEQHAKILGDQTKITERQFKFQRTIESYAGREKVYDALLELRASVAMLISKIESPGDRYEPRVAEEMMAQTEVVAAILPVQKAVLTSPHLTHEEKEYFRGYTSDLATILATNLQGRAQPLKEFTAKYKDILSMHFKIAQIPADV